MALTDDQLDAILDADATSGKTSAPDLFVRIHERRRKRAHVAAKIVQPALGVRGTAQHDELIAVIRKFFRTPLAKEELACEQGDIEYLLLTVHDTIESGDFEDAVFASLRIARKLWARNAHTLGPIEGVQIPVKPPVQIPAASEAGTSAGTAPK